MKVKKYDNVEVGKVYSSNNYGDFEVLEIYNCNEILISFIDTNFQKIVTKNNICKGEIKDLLAPSVYGVGFLGEGKYSRLENGKVSKNYILWKGMLDRCYNEKNSRFASYGGNNVVVDERWHNFQNFCEDIQHLENYNKWNNKINSFDWTLDKDKLSGNDKIYSKNTCWFTDMSTQNLLQNTKKIFGFVEGNKVFTFNNIKNISDELGLSHTSLSNCLSRLHVKSVGKYNNIPIVWRYEDDCLDILYKRNKFKRKNNGVTFDGYVNGVKIFDKLTTLEIINMKITKSSGGIINSISRNINCGKYNNLPIKWEYSKEGDTN